MDCDQIECGNKKNSCMGAYGKTLDVKLTDDCNGKCPFCIERGGKKSKPKDCAKLISAVNTLDPEAVLILGGEPFQYPHLMEFLQGIKHDGRKVFLTTNGVFLSDMSRTEITKLARCLTSINISLQHYDMDKNAFCGWMRARNESGCGYQDLGESHLWIR